MATARRMPTNIDVLDALTEKVAQEKALYIAKTIGTLTSVEILDISKYTLKKDFGDMNLEEINFFRNLTGFDLRSDKCVL